MSVSIGDLVWTDLLPVTGQRVKGVYMRTKCKQKLPPQQGVFEVRLED